MRLYLFDRTSMRFLGKGGKFEILDVYARDFKRWFFILPILKFYYNMRYSADFIIRKKNY